MNLSDLGKLLVTVGLALLVAGYALGIPPQAPVPPQAPPVPAGWVESSGGPAVPPAGPLPQPVVSTTAVGPVVQQFSATYTLNPAYVPPTYQPYYAPFGGGQTCVNGVCYPTAQPPARGFFRWR